MKYEDTLEEVTRVKREISIKTAGIVLYLTISGSHLYGFSGPDSDIDYRGCYLTDTNTVLGMHRIREVMKFKPDTELYELYKEIYGLLKGNCNVYEHLNAKPIYSTAESMTLKSLANRAMGKKGIYGSYKGLATNNHKKFILGGKASPKKYLYVVRGLMAGAHALITGTIEPNLIKLNSIHKYDIIDELIKAKTEGFENGNMPGYINIDELETTIEVLYAIIDEAYEESSLPDEPSDDIKDEINSFVIRTRKDFLG
jgi:predicted nucleotidyltransferase